MEKMIILSRRKGQRVHTTILRSKNVHLHIELIEKLHQRITDSKLFPQLQTILTIDDLIEMVKEKL